MAERPLLKQNTKLTNILNGKKLIRLCADGRPTDMSNRLLRIRNERKIIEVTYWEEECSYKNNDINSK